MLSELFNFGSVFIRASNPGCSSDTVLPQALYPMGGCRIYIFRIPLQVPHWTEEPRMESICSIHAKEVNRCKTEHFKPALLPFVLLTWRPFSAQISWLPVEYRTHLVKFCILPDIFTFMQHHKYPPMNFSHSAMHLIFT